MENESKIVNTNEIRCNCGKLLAKVVEKSVEIKE